LWLCPDAPEQNISLNTGKLREEWLMQRVRRPGFTALLAALLVTVSGIAGTAYAQLPSLPGLSGRTTTTAEKPEVTAELLADQTAIVPGGAVELAVRLTVPEGWHVYWVNHGEGGLETTFEWKLPPGYEVGPMRFPPPRRHVDEADAHTFILEGEPTFLTTLKAPADARPGEPVTIGVDVNWLICKKMCYLGNKSLSIDLPVVASADQVKPANESDFRYARKQLPVEAGKAAYLKNLRAVASVEKVKPGADFSIAVVFDVEPGYHINSHEPLEEGLIPTDVFPERVEGVEIGRPAFPPGKIEESSGQKLSVYRGQTIITLPVKADGNLSINTLRFSGVLTYQACDDEKGTCYPPTAAEWSLEVPVAGADETPAAAHTDIFQAAAAQAAPAAPGGQAEPSQAPSSRGFTLDSDIHATRVQEEHSMLVWLILAFLAGLILNVTPCVLPVISIKVLSFVQQATESPARVFKLGLAFSLGMMIVFNVLAILATALGMVWGQHFQSPTFTITIASIVFAFGLSLFGVFTLGVPQSVGDLAVKAEREGYAGSIAKGALATVMGTPCLGPFLGPVLVWATAQPPAMVFLVFNTIGLGMALPYVLLTANPRWLRFVPKAGPWLNTFKQAMAFLLMGTVVYFLHILEGQLGGAAVVWMLVFLTGVGLACWMIGTFITYKTSPAGRLGWMAAALAVVLAVGYFSLARGIEWNPPASAAAVDRVSGRQVASGELGKEAADDGEVLPWVPFSMDKLTELTAAGKPVLLDITARWCPNCQYNSAFVFNTAEVKAAVEKYGVVPMLADWTARGPEIGRLIDKLAPGGSIPLAAVFPAGRPDEPVVMLGIVTRQQIIDALAAAAAPARD